MVKTMPLKVLFLGYNDERRVGSGQYYMRKALSKYVGIVPYGPMFQMGMEKDVSKLQRIYKPDLILLQGFWPLGLCRWKNLRRTTVPKAVFFSDPHNSPKQRIKWINKNRIDMSLHHYKATMPYFRSRVFPEHRMEWLPWCANTNVYKDYGFERVYDVAVLGTIKETVYPLRAKIRDTLLRRDDITVFYRPRPSKGYNVDPKKTLMRENYARAIARCKIYIFTGSKLRYPVQKYFESMACKTLPLATTPLDAENLHFKPGYNFVEINENNFAEKILYYLKHKEEREKIASNGYLTIHKYHTCRIRIKQLFKHLESVVEGS